MIAETVVKSSAEIIIHIFPHVEGECAVGTEGAKVVDTAHVVVVAVSHEHGIHMIKIASQGLLAEVGGCINKQFKSMCAD